MDSSHSNEETDGCHDSPPFPSPQNEEQEHTHVLPCNNDRPGTPVTVTPDQIPHPIDNPHHNYGPSLPVNDETDTHTQFTPTYRETIDLSDFPATSFFTDTALDHTKPLYVMSSEDRVKRKAAKQRDYYLDNKEKKVEYQKEYYINNKEKILENQKEYYIYHWEEQRDYGKKYYANNREKILEKQKEHYADNTEEILEKQKEYYADNREEILEKQKEYYADNREEILEKQKEYYADNREEILEKRKEHYVDNTEKILEKKKEHYADNTEKILEKKKEYYADNREKILEKQKQNRKRKRDKQERIEMHQALVDSGESLLSDDDAKEKAQEIINQTEELLEINKDKSAFYVSFTGEDLSLYDSNKRNGLWSRESRRFATYFSGNPSSAGPPLSFKHVNQNGSPCVRKGIQTKFHKRILTREYMENELGGRFMILYQSFHRRNARKVEDQIQDKLFHREFGTEILWRACDDSNRKRRDGDETKIFTVGLTVLDSEAIRSKICDGELIINLGKYDKKEGKYFWEDNEGEKHFFEYDKEEKRHFWVDNKGEKQFVE